MSDQGKRAGKDPGQDWRAQFDAFAQQFAQAWRVPGAGAAPGFQDGLALWAQMTGQRAPAAEDVLERFSQQSRGYFELMRTAFERMQGGASAGDVTAAWREAMSAASGGNPVAEALSTLSGQGARGMQQMAEGVEAMLGPMRGQFDALAGMPAFGLAREHQQRSQQFARDLADQQAATNRYTALLLEASEQAFVRFERKLAERSEPGRQIESARALYDLWIDAAEEAYAEIALSPRFRDAYGAMVNAQMRVRRGVQQSIERAAVELDLPTRRELDSAHRRVHDLQRELRVLRQRLDAVERQAAGPDRTDEGGARGEPKAAPSRPRAKSSAGKPVRAAAKRKSAAPAASKSAKPARTQPRAAAAKKSPTSAARRRRS